MHGSFPKPYVNDRASILYLAVTRQSGACNDVFQGAVHLNGRLGLGRGPAGSAATAAAMVRDPGLAPLLGQRLHVMVHRLGTAVVQDRNGAHLLSAAKHLQRY